MSMLVAFGRSIGYTGAGWRRDRVRPFEGNTDVFWFGGNYEAHKDLRKRKGIDADQPHRVAYKKLVRASTSIGALMFTTRTLNRLALAATVTVGFACGDDDPTGPDGVTFPDWPAPAISALCVRGTALVGDTKSGTISVADCDGADVNPDVTGYFETWRVRVATAGDVTFDLSSSFDNFLTVLRVNSVTASGGSATVIADNDNRSQTNLNALVTVRLEPNIDYVVGISGFDEAATGAYTLVIR